MPVAGRLNGRLSRKKYFRKYGEVSGDSEIFWGLVGAVRPAQKCPETCAPSAPSSTVKAQAAQPTVRLGGNSD